MAQQSSRLHRLLTLLDTGSTHATRLAAARQLGDIVKSHPDDLNSLVNKVSQYLHSKNWDTRVAAAHAIGFIVQNVKRTSLAELFSWVESKMLEAGFTVNMKDLAERLKYYTEHNSSISFKSFDIAKVLDFGALLASGGQEYDVANDISKNPMECLARQKQNLWCRLGLDICEQFMDVIDMIKDEDLVEDSHSGGCGLYLSPSAQRIQKLVSSMSPSLKSRGPSTRELNLLKRKAKVNTKDQAKGWSGDVETDVSSSSQVMSPMSASPDSLNFNKVDTEEDFSENNVDGQWPFDLFVEQLMLDMFDPVWEVRHGSILALREILTHDGGSAGVVVLQSGYNGTLADLKGNDFLRVTKGEEEVDLNIQDSANELCSNPKRRKLEHVFSISCNKSGNMDIHSRETNACDLSGEKSNESVAKVETGISFKNTSYSHQSLSRTDLKNSSLQLVSAVKSDDQSTFSENYELMALVKQANYCWLRNSEFLQDCTLRLLCILLLDRFGDFVSDQVVAPVREVGAQALGAAIKYMDCSLVFQTLNILLQMQCMPQWEIRHGSLLGIKYLIAVRQEMLPDLLDSVIPACKAGLEDLDDDVRAVAADALIPAAASIVSGAGITLQSIVTLLWDILLDLDDLSPSTSSVMNLLAELYSLVERFPNMICKTKCILDLNESYEANGAVDGLSQENPYALTTLAPRLWPFMRHTIMSVRHSAIRTLERLLEAGYQRNLSAPSDTSFWPPFILKDTFRAVFQNLLLESNEEILQCSERVWRLLVRCPIGDVEAVVRFCMPSWIDLSTTPHGSLLDSAKLFCPLAPSRMSNFRSAAKMKDVGLKKASRTINSSDSISSKEEEKNWNSSSGTWKLIADSDFEMCITKTRVITSSALGILASKVQGDSLLFVIGPLWNALTSLSGVHRQVASLVLISWFKEFKKKVVNGMIDNWPAFPFPIERWLLGLLSCSDPSFPTEDSFLPYSELSHTYAKMRQEARLLFHAVESSGVAENWAVVNKIDTVSLRIDEALDFASKVPASSNIIAAVNESERQSFLGSIMLAKQQLLTTSGYLKCVQNNLHVTVSALVAASVVWMSDLPVRLNPIILPLMTSIKREQEEILQDIAAEALAELICRCLVRKPCPNDKLIKNICNLTCADPCETPQVGEFNSLENSDVDDAIFWNCVSGRKSRVRTLGVGEDKLCSEGFISRRGSELGLKHLCLKFGSSLFEKLPKMWDFLTEVLIGGGFNNDQQTVKVVDSLADPQSLINSMQVLRSIAQFLDPALKPKLMTLLPSIFSYLCHSNVAVRLAASMCITSMAKSMTNPVMAVVIENVLSMLSNISLFHARHGAGMLINFLVHGLGVELVPYSSLLIVPLLRCMGDCDHSVRYSVMHSFAALVPLLPLARGLAPPSGLDDINLTRNAKDVQFLEQLLDNSQIEDYELCVRLKVTLRRYQQEGINWLAFLKCFKLNGILCDDMGLGKTLQASAIMASDIVERRNGKSNAYVNPSLIVCPSTLVGHWAFEIDKYIDVSVIRTLQYTGSSHERLSLNNQFVEYDIIIASYDVVRKDVDHLCQFLWNYCILDEGHVIKNAKSKITIAVKQLKAEHRLLLSGTPIQNNIMDLWSLFDFLMPGFLGTERQFQATYGKPLLAAKDLKCSTKDAEAGALAMEALHKQVMPFLLRRTKDEVLSDLPEKIIQDRYCDLSPVQSKLYEHFSGTQVKQEIRSMVKPDQSSDASQATATHVFQAIQYLLKLCSHPLLVVGETLSDSLVSLLSENFSMNSDMISELHKLHHSPKLVALQEILEECGIGIEAPNMENASVSQHRVLIFAQHKVLLDIIERDLFHTHMKSVTYLRLDGSVESAKRFEIVKSFNSDPTIDAMLLTTHVGGLGLNLTSADTLIFMEHDWNPMRDHQAMDRAHRLGQKRIVNVHRLIMRATLEEKVMNLQKFKLSIANAIINAENTSLQTMNTDRLLDIFASIATDSKGATPAIHVGRSMEDEPKSKSKAKGLKAMLGELGELWDQAQYSEEYNLNQFLEKLNGSHC